MSSSIEKYNEAIEYLQDKGYSAYEISRASEELIEGGKISELGMKNILDGKTTKPQRTTREKIIQLVQIWQKETQSSQGIEVLKDNRNSKKSTDIKDDSKIMQNVIYELRTNALQLSKDLGYKSPTSIYHILQGRNGITIDLANRLVGLYPKVNFLYLTKGELPILKKDDKSIYQQKLNLFDDDSSPTYEIELQLTRIANSLEEIRLILSKKN